MREMNQEKENLCVICGNKPGEKTDVSPSRFIFGPVLTYLCDSCWEEYKERMGGERFIQFFDRFILPPFRFNEAERKVMLAENLKREFFNKKGGEKVRNAIVAKRS